MRSTHMIARATVAVTLALAAACASAGKRYEQGLEMEQAGRPADAAERYVQALKKDPSLAGARDRLREVGNRAVTDYVGESSAALAAGRPADAADALLQLDDLRRDAQSVGVTLDVPPNYAARRADAFGRAVDQALAEGEQSMVNGDYAGAVRWLDRAQQRWEPAPGQRGRMDTVRFDALTRWAATELRSEHPRAAYERAALALQVYGRDNPAAERALEIQAEALRRGTVRVAVLPVGARQAVREKLPDDLFPELNDELSLNQWRRMPLFVDVMDPVATGREARRHGYARQGISITDAIYVGRQMGADLVVVNEIDSVRTQESDVHTTRRAARTTAGVDTAFTVREGRQETWARVSWQIVDVRDRRVVDRGSTSASSGARFRTGVYAGDWHTLDLTSRDRELFDTRSSSVSREVVRELVSGLSERMGREILSDLERAVP